MGLSSNVFPFDTELIHSDEPAISSKNESAVFEILLTFLSGISIDFAFAGTGAISREDFVRTTKSPCCMVGESCPPLDSYSTVTGIWPPYWTDFGFDRGQFEIFVIVQILRNLPFNFRRFRGSVDDDGFVLPVLRSAGAVHLRVTDGKGSKNASQPSMASDLASAFYLDAVFPWVQSCFQVQYRPLKEARESGLLSCLHLTPCLLAPASPQYSRRCPIRQKYCKRLY